MAGNKLAGLIPVEIGDLQWLKILDLPRNEISGAIPDELYTILSLEEIILNSNRELSGIISTDIGNLTSLTVFSIHENKHTGPIPLSLTTLPNLSTLSLYKNNLTGTIIPELGNLTTLKALRIGDNDYSPGIIPPELGNLTNLTSLTIDKSNLIGTLPPELGNLLLLSVFYIQTNALTGPIPPEYGNFTEARSFLWSDNQLTGSIPSVLENWTKCKNFYVGNNQLSGPIPPELGNMTAMEQLNLGNNMLDGAIPSTLGNLSKVSHLVFSGNQLTGSIPASLTGLTELYQLHLSNNQLSGIIPDFTPLTGLGFDSKSVEFLWIDGNQYQFGDFENEFATYKANMTSLDVSPQAKLDLPLVLNENTGDDVTLSVTVPSGTQLHYTWYKNNTVIAEAPDSPNLTLTNIQVTDAGTYRCDVSSDIVTDLTLQRHNITLNISAAPLSNPFITTWKTDNFGNSADDQIRIPTFFGETYDYDVDWGDGTTTTGETGNAVHTYATPGTYTVSITGTFPRIYFNDTGDASKLLTIEQWGDNTWTSMEGAFDGCENLQGNFTDAPNLSAVTSMASMFQDALIFNYDISNWDVNNVTDMSSLFEQAELFNQDISNWNVSNVTNMSSMFEQAEVFNQDISGWNVGRVMKMNSMFANANAFNSPIGGWNVSNVTDMSRMFNRATVFNQDIGSWNVSNVTTMALMFTEARVFNQDIGNWNVNKVTSMNNMFNAANRFNHDLGNWDITSVTDIRRMFIHAHDFNQDISGWDVSRITSMEGMFAVARSFNQDIGNWDVSNVTDMSIMFSGAQDFDQDIGNWNVMNLTNAATMFGGVTLSTPNYDALLIGWNDLNLQLNVPFSGGNSQYCEGTVARTNMISSDGWTITDRGTAAPMLNDLADQNEPNSYTLPVITGTNLTGAQSYFTGPNGTGTQYNANHVINYGDFPSYPVTIYIYDGAGSCASQEDFSLIITTTCTSPILDDLADQNEPNSYTLPEITGTNLTGNEMYFTETSGAGTSYSAGTTLNYIDFPSYPVTLYIYDENATMSHCNDEQDFLLTLTVLAPQVSINTSHEAVCDTDNTIITLTAVPNPLIATGSYSYAWSVQGNPTILGTNSTLDVSPIATTTYVVTLIDDGLPSTFNSGTDEQTITVGISPKLDTIGDVEACNSYILPEISGSNLSGNEIYSDDSTGVGNQYPAGSTINFSDYASYPVTLYVYDENKGDNYVCSNEVEFTLTLTNSPIADNQSDVNQCSSYSLPILSENNNYFTATNGGGTQLNVGHIITATQTIFIYTETSVGSNVCSDESSFTVTISQNEVADSPVDVFACESYILPELSPGNFYYTESNAGGSQLHAGANILSSQTIFFMQVLSGAQTKIASL